MQVQLYTINSLAVQLKMDRRSMAKKLEGLKPAKETKRKDGSVVRSWYLADVVAYLNDPRAVRQSDQQRAEADAMQEKLNESIATELFPLMFDQAIPLMTGSLVDLGLTKGQSLRICEFVLIAMHHGLCEALGKDDVTVGIPSTLLLAKEMGYDAFIKKHWPLEYGPMVPGHDPEPLNRQ